MAESLVGPSFDALQSRTTQAWTSIVASAARSVQETEKLKSALSVHPAPVPSDGGMIVFGSLARGEHTEGSDLDWTLLIDGCCDSAHLKAVHEIKRRVKEAGFENPGPTEMFGGLSFGHGLVHEIGGEEDSNRNMTRRLLLLLESKAVDVGTSRAVRERVVRAVISRYVVEDASYLDAERSYARVPRFLLNDMVRLWRTMAVDYAHKYRTRNADKWALRNIKLRMSRKLIFVSGLLMCVTWGLEGGAAPGVAVREQDLVEHLLAFTERPPLESLSAAFERYAPEAGVRALSAYEGFLQLLSDSSKRQALAGLSPEKAYNDPVFKSARSFSDEFDHAVQELTLRRASPLREQVLRYGVF